MEIQNTNSIELNRESFILILSIRRSGKSFLISQLIYNFMNASEENRTTHLYMFSNTAKIDQKGQYNFVDKKAIFSANPENVERIVTRIVEIQKETNKKNHILLVFDDIDLSGKYSSSIEWLAVQGRHYNITVILSAQIATTAISPLIRNNYTYLFFRKLNKESIEKQIYGMIINNEFETPKDFREFVSDNIHDYRFIFYDNDSDEKQLSIIKAVAIPQDYKYIIKSPPKEANLKPRRHIGWGAPMNLTYFDSEGNAIKYK
jgi:hypothetical protein